MTSRLTLVTAVDCHLCEHARSVAHRLAAELKFEIRDLVVDGQGLVHQAEMRARGHFMDQRYFDFDAAFSIVPPVV